jgi:hypothetical protein
MFRTLAMIPSANVSIYYHPRINPMFKNTALSLLLLVPAAMATPKQPSNGGYQNPKPPQATSLAAAGAEANAHAASQSNSASISSAEQGQQAVALNEGNTTQTTVSSTYKQVRQAPGATTSASDTTASCQKDRRIGVSSVVGGLSFGASRTDRDCRLLDRADYEDLRGNVSASIRLRCATSVYRKALGEDCEALLFTPVPARPIPSDQAAREKRILEKAVQK